MPTTMTNVSRDIATASELRPSNGFLATTTMLTADGALPVEWIAQGDRIITRDCGMVTLRRMTQWRYHGPLITIPKGALGPSLPTEDIQLLPDQMILLTDGHRGERPVVIRAQDLANGCDICVEDATDGVDLRCLDFDAPHLVYAAGLATGTGGPTGI
jgi:hypothetical protein